MYGVMALRKSLMSATNDRSPASRRGGPFVMKHTARCAGVWNGLRSAQFSSH
jgi:hypothetical protein